MCAVKIRLLSMCHERLVKFSVLLPHCESSLPPAYTCLASSGSPLDLSHIACITPSLRVTPNCRKAEEPAMAKGPDCRSSPPPTSPFLSLGWPLVSEAAVTTQSHNSPPSRVTHFGISQPGGHKMQRGSRNIPQL
jgi:hypothetical protein